MSKRIAFAFLILIASFYLGASSAPQEHKSGSHGWAYEGKEAPAHWGDLSPEFATCKLGREQSPIDIQNAKSMSLPPIVFDYHASPLRIIDNEHTIQVNYAAGSTISIGGHRYELRQFHFHDPSEEKIKDRSYDMVAHLVHADTKGNLAVVAVLLEKGRDSSLIQTLWDHLPGQKGKEEDVKNLQINAADLLPPKLGYFTFKGSLTTPPCTEGVSWFVLKTPSQISEAEINTFAHLYPNNARPTQPLNRRAVMSTR